MIKKIIALFCTLIMLSLCLVSCKDELPKDTAAGNTTNGAVILTSELADYTIVYSKNCDAKTVRKIDVLSAKLYSLYGVAVKTSLDSKCEESEKEILVGYTNRAESLEFLSDFRSCDYGYAMVGGKLCIAGATDEYTVMAIDEFMRTMLAKTSEKWELSAPNVTKGEYTVDDLKLNGESIKGWSVSYASENKNSEKDIALLIRDKIAEVSGFAPFLCTDKDNVTDKVITVSASDCDASVAVSGNRIDICGRDTEALMQAATTLLNKLSGAAVNGSVLEATLENNPTLSQYLTVMSFNVRFDLTENAGVSRVDAAVAQIRDLSPDVFGIQEDSQQWCSLLDQKLTEYTAVRSLLQAGKDEYLTIYYKTDAFTKVKSGLLWLSDTPSTPNSKFSESSMTRAMSYVILENKTNGARFCFVNTHLEHTASSDVAEIRKVARQKQTQVLLEQTAKITADYGNIPSIMVGDFNTTANDSIHSTIRMSGYRDCRTDALSISSQGTWNDGYYGGSVNASSDVLDFCYVSENGFYICSYKTSTDKYNNMYTSDHFPIVIKLLLY